MDKRAVSKKTWSLVARMRLGLLLLFIPVLMLGGIYYLHMERSLQNELQQRLLATNHQLRHVFIEPYLHEMERQFTLIYDQVQVADISGPRLHNTETYLKEWQLYKGVMADLVYIYIGTAERQMLIYPAWQADANFDPRVRPWYQLASQHVGKMVWTEPYYDYTNGNLVIALARALTDQDGKVRGVFAMDAILAPFSAQLNRQLGDGYQMVVNQSGKVLAHPDTAQLLKPMAHPEWLSRFSQEDGIFLDKASSQFVAYSKLTERNWVLISVQPAASVMAVVERVSLNVQLMVALACVLYVMLALVWSRYFRRMLDEISSMIRASRMQPDDVPQGGMRELRHVYAELAEVSKDYHEARQQANLDKLTGLYNRRFFDERVNRLLFEHQPFCLAMVDLDDFKRVNDTFGHQTGDVVLKRVSKLGMRLLGDHGWVCRYGGEELVVLLVNPDINFCQMLLEQFRKGVESLDWREPELRITFSGGLVASQAGMDGKTLLEIADAEVYRAKRDGKNRIYLGRPEAKRQEDAPPADDALLSKEEA
ncbi:sensor domain-containing diguanylate cyclase [Aeromonas hydrophila]|uniref:sensor domain-containing diguanylate cyclase n=1 Tax=Aeromonas hydrophila TaxID=644 RepID=UPI001D4DF75B|nr:sensor domain-containing diguanylate cyclase [Aeromonas hydrophila]EHK5440942.1 diguanylate cyclase [Aeromonas hydrophila]MCR3953313.1 diguanylate cyclase [Aeromonas hydrophila]MCW4617410.1 diguanylate cyclase [Aeromonas hydrophila]